MVSRLTKAGGVPAVGGMGAGEGAGGAVAVDAPAPAPAPAPSFAAADAAVRLRPPVNARLREAAEAAPRLVWCVEGR